ncbi:MAG: hypothetical protein Ct9H300mP11_13680 [Chloroflexota bacterium]|nr:MAG: hypothetical protein Ct9H300mP11_13680 [Chloroflexota bacterium]
MAYNNLAIDGARLDHRLRYAVRRPGDRRISAFAPNAKFVHIDFDASEVEKKHQDHRGNGRRPEGGFLGQLLPKIEPNVHINWRRRIDQLKGLSTRHISSGSPMNSCPSM